jgi:hypothetical protein
MVEEACFWAAETECFPQSLALWHGDEIEFSLTTLSWHKQTKNTNKNETEKPILSNYVNKKVKPFRNVRRIKKNKKKEKKKKTKTKKKLTLEASAACWPRAAISLLLFFFLSSASFSAKHNYHITAAIRQTRTERGNIC